MSEVERMRKVAMEAALKAGKYALKRLDGVKEISQKDGVNNLVTDVDRLSEKMIIDHIHKIFPSHSILAEESGEHDGKGEFKWIIDPLDGTTNYAHGFPVFCVSIGVIGADGKSKIGVVYDPSRNEIFYAEEGGGAFLNKKNIRVSTKESVQESLIATGFAYSLEGKVSSIDYFRTILNHAQAVRRAGSAAIDLCYVACGRFDGFWEMGLSPWDTAAGYLIVKEAGGSITTLDGMDFNIFSKEIISTNSRIHKELLALLNLSQN
ncbi:MAG: inositol monophosphatase [Candidatus Omnitrophica bacterium]|nr:inositol monophosphatase [Candidatus Omnitrophota bacterium]